MVDTMAAAGVPLMDCVQTAHDLCDNGYFQDLWKQRQRPHPGRPAALRPSL